MTWIKRAIASRLVCIQVADSVSGNSEESHDGMNLIDNGKTLLTV